MRSASDTSIIVRDAEEADVPALTTIKGDDSGTVHRDRLRDASEAAFAPWCWWRRVP